MGVGIWTLDISVENTEVLTNWTTRLLARVTHFLNIWKYHNQYF